MATEVGGKARECGEMGKLVSFKNSFKCSRPTKIYIGFYPSVLEISK